MKTKKLDWAFYENSMELLACALEALGAAHTVVESVKKSIAALYGEPKRAKKKRKKLTNLSSEERARRVKQGHALGQLKKDAAMARKIAKLREKKMENGN